MRGRKFPRRDWLKGAGLGFLSLLGGRLPEVGAVLESTDPIDVPDPASDPTVTSYLPVATRDITTREIGLAECPGFFPAGALPLIGTVNRDRFGAYEPGTLMLMGASTDRRIDGDGRIGGTGRLRFVARDRPWGDVVGPDGAWTTYLDATGNPLYTEMDFAAGLPGGESILGGADVGPWVAGTGLAIG